MKGLDNVEIVTKCVEINKSLLNTNVGMHNYDLEVTSTIGDLARLSILLRNSIELNDSQLGAIGAALKIDSRIIRKDLLYTLQSLDWIDIEKDNHRIKRIRTRIPPTEDIIKYLGEEWENRQPTDIDIGSVKLLKMTSERPYELEAAKSELSIKEIEFESLLGYGNEANYFGKMKSEEIDKDLIWTPLYWLDKVDSVENYLSNSSENKIQKLSFLYNKLKNNQGMPIDQISDPVAKNLVTEAESYGFFPSSSMEKENGEHFTYVFTPFPKFNLDPVKDVFERARLIVACLRHGQHHADVTKIKYPVKILNKLISNELQPHSYAVHQYSPLLINNIVRIKDIREFYGQSYKVEWIDTPENAISAKIAKLMLEGENPSIGSAEDVEAQIALHQGVYNYTSEQRRILTNKKISAPNEFHLMIERLRTTER